MWIWLDSNERDLHFLISYVLEVSLLIVSIKNGGNTHLGNFEWVFMMFSSWKNFFVAVVFRRSFDRTEYCYSVCCLLFILFNLHIISVYWIEGFKLDQLTYTHLIVHIQWYVWLTNNVKCFGFYHRSYLSALNNYGYDIPFTSWYLNLYSVNVYFVLCGTY